MRTGLFPCLLQPKPRDGLTFIYHLFGVSSLSLLLPLFLWFFNWNSNKKEIQDPKKAKEKRENDVGEWNFMPTDGRWKQKCCISETLSSSLGASFSSAVVYAQKDDALVFGGNFDATARHLKYFFFVKLDIPHFFGLTRTFFHISLNAKLDCTCSINEFFTLASPQFTFACVWTNEKVLLFEIMNKKRNISLHFLCLRVAHNSITRFNLLDLL